MVRDIHQLQIRATPTEVTTGDALHVAVIDDIGNPISDATVSLSSGEKVTTNEEGMAAFVTNEPGEYVLTAKKPNSEFTEFKSASTTVQVQKEGVQADLSEPADNEDGDGNMTENEEQKESQLWDKMRIGIERGMPTIVYEGKDT